MEVDPVDIEESLRLLFSDMVTLDSMKADVGQNEELRTEMQIQNAVDRKHDVKLSAAEVGRELRFWKPKEYTYSELAKFTSNFKEKIGAGTFGQLYFGKLLNGLEIVVKVMRGEEFYRFEFAAQTIGMTCHRNLVKLIGFCSDIGMKALVYQYMKNGSLDAILYNKSSIFQCSDLYRVAIKIAKALAYLHDGFSDAQIIHLNLKPSNVLFDAPFSPKVTGFGMDNILNTVIGHETLIKFRGTRGYASPEVWATFPRVTSKADVYSFGMILFEILRRQHNGEGKHWFPRMVWKKFADDKLDNILTDCGITEKDWRKATVLSRVALWCAQHTPETRPSMSTVAAVLEMETLVNAPPHPFSPSDSSTSKMQAEVHYPKVPAFVYTDHSSSRNDVKITEPESTQSATMSPEQIEVLISDLDFGKAKRYSYNDLVNFTSNFDKRIGYGAYGNVYIGRFSDGMEIAVKVMGKGVAGETFVTEVRTMAKADHKNLVELLGFCLEENVKALVYEYMENGSLDKILSKKVTEMEWEKLYLIAIEIAKAVAYLHDDCGKQIIHYDIKPANILLDSYHRAKLADFGLAKLMDIGVTHYTMTRVKGTRGFMAPEIYSPFSHVTFKCDVYSFGMLLFEILGIKQNNDTGMAFPMYVWDKIVKGNLNDMIEECGIKEKNRNKALTLSLVAVWCAQYTPDARPSMSDVVKALEKEILVNSPPDPAYPTNSLAKMRVELTSPDMFTSTNEGSSAANLTNSRKRTLFKRIFSRARIN